MQPAGFNPNDNKYKGCCCHAKTFTIVSGILEIFTICFILVAVLPDLNTRFCDSSDGTGNESFVTTEPPSNSNSSASMIAVRVLLCEMNFACLIFSVAQIIAINMMFYGIKIMRWLLFVPHITFRILCVLLIGALEGLIAYLLFSGGKDVASYVAGMIFVGLLAALCLYAAWIEIRCAHFVKRSHETGFSISVARPIGPATISLSERDAPLMQLPARQLPPLRNTRHSYGPPAPQDNKLGE